MNNEYNENDYRWVKELMNYPNTLNMRLDFFDDTSEINIPDDPIEKVIFQEKAKKAIRKIAQNKGHILMVGRPGTGKSMLANMFKNVLDKSLGDYLRPVSLIIACPGKDKNHIRFSYENPKKIDKEIASLRKTIEEAKANMDDFSLAEQINSVKKVRRWLLGISVISAICGIFFPIAFIFTGLTGMGSIFMYIQENNHKVQEKIQNENHNTEKKSFKPFEDMIPEILYDPRKETDLMTRVSEPNSRNMKGGFRHDPYQSSGLYTPPHKRAFLGAHAKSPIIYIDELKTLIKAGYMSDLLEIMQNKKYILEGGNNMGSGAADRSENYLSADNLIIACCNHDTLEQLQQEGDGAFLSRIEDKGEIIHMESAVPETLENTLQVAQYIKQEIINFNKEIKNTWGKIIEQEGYEGARKRSEHLFGRPLPKDYKLESKEFSRKSVLEIIKELRCRSSDGKLTSLLRPINGIIKTAEYEAIFESTTLVEPRHIRLALKEHLSIEGGMAQEIISHKKDLKKYIASMTDSIGYVVGLAVINSKSSGQMYGQPLPIHCQINAGGADSVIAPGKIGDIAKAAAQNVRASIKQVLTKIRAPYVGYEMHVEYIQAHGGVEGDSASVAMDVALISDFIQKPVNQRYGITGSLTGNIILAVGGVTEKVKSIMDSDLGMLGACIPWQNKYDIEPLLINIEYEYVQENGVPGIRIFRERDRQNPFDIYFCKTKYHTYQILMGLGETEVEEKMAERSKKDLEFILNIKGY